ncbi:hypothetical protein [Marisediminitalea sp.]|uniref:hypothetical protein n=1 Tax=Marisediminitalea sp. TaxID=2662268 RepID=UPI003519792C
MRHLIENLAFKADVDFVTQDSPCYKSSEYPPEKDFVLSITKEGDVVSRYSDDTWDFTAFGSRQKFQFGEYDEYNKMLFKQLMYYMIYSHLFPGKYSSLTVWYKSYQLVFRACSKAQIKANDLKRFPRVVEELAESYAKSSPSNFNKSIWHYDVIIKNQDQIGFTLLDERSIAIFKQFDPTYELGQTAYIPNRLWTQYIQYLDSILHDFVTHQDKLENLFHYLTQTSIENENRGVPSKESSPFMKGSIKAKIYYEGTFDDYLQQHGLLVLLEKYTERPNEPRISYFKIDQFGSLLNNMMVSCYLYVLFYSIMRKNEALSLRVDCFKTDSDVQMGTFYLLAGETTKTDPDSDARWVVPKRVEKAIRIAKKMVEWKLRYVQAGGDAPFLFQNMSAWQMVNRNLEVRAFKSLDNVVARGLKFFKPEQFDIRKQDYDEALALTPSLIRHSWFKVGGIWTFTYHQFRRTLAVHFALNKVSVSSTQLQMKHGTREQQFHYQNNAGRLRLNRLAEQEVTNEYYAEMSRNIISVVEGDQILPHKYSPVKQDVIHFVEEGDMKKLKKAQLNGSIGYRKNILGGCMKQGVCEYGGFDSITHCTGGAGGNMCSDLVIDGGRASEFTDDKQFYETQMTVTPNDSPKYKALKAEVSGYEKVLHIIETRLGDKK